MAILNHKYNAARTLGLFAALMSLTSCFSDFEPDIESTPVLCLNTSIVAGDSIKVELTRTWRWDEGYPGTDFDLTVTDAIVTMSVNNGEYTETLKKRQYDRDFSLPPLYQALTKYVADYIPRQGDIISFEAKSPQYGDASGETTVPYATPIDSVTYEVLNLKKTEYGESSEYSFDLRMKIWLTDPEESTDFYQFAVGFTSKYNYPGWDESMPNFWFHYSEINYDREPLFTEHVSTLESAVSETSGYHIFSDRQIAGMSYPLKIDIDQVEYSVSGGNGEILGSINLTLSSLSRSYYDHVISVWVANDGITGALGSIGLGNAVFESSNVSTGAGVVAASANSCISLQMADIISCVDSFCCQKPRRVLILH